VADPARKRLLKQIMNAVTREEIDAAWAAQHAWLMANPDDFGVLAAGEDLAYAEVALTGVDDPPPDVVERLSKGTTVGPRIGQDRRSLEG